jgi:hypothetical protein
MKRLAIMTVIFIQTICAIAQQVGSKVSLPAVDSKMYAGTITEIRGNQSKVKYDGFDFESSLSSSQFTVTDFQNGGIRTGTPQRLCRNELSVFFAGMSGLGAAWGRAANEPFTMNAVAVSDMQGVLGNARDALNMVHCIGFDINKLSNLISRLPSLSNIQAVAEIEALIKELQGIIANVQLDCGNGATLTSLYVSAIHVGAAQAWTSSRICMPTPMPLNIQTVIANHLSTAASAFAGFLPCTPGVTLSQFSSIPLNSTNSAEPHTRVVGLYTNLLWNISLSECCCNCTDKNTTNTNTTKCWPGSHAVYNPQLQKTECFCNTGLVWNSTKTACVDPQELVRAADCSVYPGSYAAWNTQTQRVECWCPTGKTWNSTKTACIDLPNGGNNGKGGTGNWTLVSVTASPQTPSQGWNYNTQSSSAHMAIYNGDQADFQWTQPPQQFNSSGFTISLSVTGKPVQNSGISALIGVSGSGLTSDTPDGEQSANAKALNGSSATAQKSVTFKPASNSSDIEVKIVLMWGSVSFIYKYRRT